MQIENIPLDSIAPDPRQPRRGDFEVAELAASIREHGVLQPVGVRPVQLKTDTSKKFMLIFGGRRFEAAQLAGLPTIPAIIRKGNQSTLGVQLVENMQRRDLSAKEYIAGIERLLTEEGLTQSQVAKMLGVNPSDISKRLSLKDAPPEVQALISERADSLNHALEIRKVADREFRAELSAQAARGASVAQIKERIQKAAQDEAWRKESQTPDTFTRAATTKYQRREKDAEEHVEERITSILNQLSALPAWVQNCGEEYSQSLPERWEQIRYAVTRCEKARKAKSDRRSIKLD